MLFLKLGNAIRAKTCTGYSEQNRICDHCKEIKFDKRLHNNIHKKAPLPEKVKFTPKHYWDNNALKNHLKNLHLREVWNLLNNDNDFDNNNFWITLADKALQGVFNDKPIFTGLCQVMDDAAERKIRKVNKQNMKYSEEFTNFLIILGGISVRALDLFRKNLEA